MTAAADVIETLRPMLGRAINVNEEMMREEDEHAATYTASGRERDQIMELLGPAPVEIDDLIRERRLKPSVVVAVVLELELAGLVKRHRRNLVSIA